MNSTKKTKKLFFMTGTNCSGKSSIAKHFLSSCKNEHIEFEFAPPKYEKKHKNRITVLSEINMMIVGKYSENTTAGGCDTICKKAYTQEMLKKVWERDEDIFMEGYLIGTGVWIKELLEMCKDTSRELHYLHPIITLDTCFKRIKNRSGKSKEQLKNNGHNVTSKHKGVETLHKRLIKEMPEIIVSKIKMEGRSTKEICEEIISLKNHNV